MTKLYRIVSLGLLLAGILLPCLVCAEPRERNVLVIPVEFKDVTFTYSPDNLEAFLNGRDFLFEGATGSVSKYFGDQFGDSLALRFQMTPTVSLSRERAFYGEDNAFGEDSRPDEMVREACTSLDEILDFSVFDNDSTGCFHAVNDHDYCRLTGGRVRTMVSETVDVNVVGVFL